MKVKHSFISPLYISILIELALNVLLLAWIKDIISIIFLGNTQLFIILDVLLYLLLLFIIWFFFFRIEYTFFERKIVVSKKHFLYSSDNIIFINGLDLIVDERFNIFLDILQLEYLKIYDTRLNRIISIIVNKNNADEILNLIKRHNIEKVPYSLGKDFFYDNKNIFIILINSIYMFGVVYFYGLLLIYSLEINHIGTFNLALYYSLGLLTLFLFTTIIDIAHQLNTQIKISDYNLSLERGSIFKRRVDMPLRKIDAISVKSSIASRIFNSYTLKLPLTKRSNLNVPIKKEFLDSMFIFKRSDHQAKGSKINIFSLILFIILIVITFVLFMFTKPLIGITLSLILLAFYLECMTSRISIIENNSITFKNGVLLQRTKILNIQIIQIIKVRKFLFNQNILTFKTYKKSYTFIVDKEKCEEIKERLK